jgi:hypothetical protein
MKRLVMIAMACVAAAGGAQAETWRAELEPVPGSDSLCPMPALFFEMALDGSEFSVRRPNGDRERGPVGPDGTVKLQFATIAGTTTISGNPRTKALQFAARAIPGCVYALTPIEPSRKLTHWKGTISAVTVNNMCSQGDRGMALDSGRAISVIWGRRFLFGAPLKADGSTELWTRTSTGNNTQAKVTVVPGTGPREVSWVTFSNACRYRVVPD